MPNAALRLLCLPLVAALVAASAPAFASAQRTFVASTGKDANPCSITAPCRGFAAAVAQTADGGEVIVLDSAGYGVVTIAQSVSIIAPQGVYAGISVFTGDGITIGGSNLNVALRGLAINGQGGSRGIVVSGVGTVVSIENCVVSNMAQTGIEGDFMQALSVRNSIIRGNQNGGIYIYGGYDSLDNVILEDNHGAGLIAFANAYVSVRRSTARHNTGQGMIVWGINPGDVTQLSVDASEIEDNVLSGLELIVAGLSREARLVVTRSTIVRNSGDGILSKVDGGIGRLDASEVQIDGNVSHGIETSVTNGGLSEARAWGDRVGHNGGYGFKNGGGVFETIGNNLVRGNFTGDKLGSITVQPGD